jgi:hypothetical protein
MVLSSLRNRKNAIHRSDNDAAAVEPDDLQRGPERASEFMSPLEMTNDQRLNVRFSRVANITAPSAMSLGAHTSACWSDAERFAGGNPGDSNS